MDGALSEVPRCETDSDCLKFEVLCSGSSGEDDLGSAKSEVLRPGAPGEDDLCGDKSEVLRCEDVSGGDVFEVLRSGDHELGSTSSWSMGSLPIVLLVSLVVLQVLVLGDVAVLLSDVLLWFQWFVHHQ